MKVCNQCGKSKELSEFYSQKKENGIYYNPKCKSCCVKNAKEWRKENPEQFKISNRSYKRKSKYLPKHARHQQTYRENGNLKKWQQNNKDKLKIYRLSRAHKKHTITDDQWKSCLDYFDQSCAYCGMKNDEHKILFNERLHMEHVDHKGKNDLSNCIPSCKSCNSSKGEKSLTDWYNEQNQNYTDERLKSISKWLSEDYIKYM